MMARTQITLEPEMQRQARKRASELGVSLAEYVRRLVARDLGGSSARPDPSCIFNLGRSGSSNVAVRKHAMIGEAIAHRYGKQRISSSK